MSDELRMTVPNGQEFDGVPSNPTLVGSGFETDVEKLERMTLEVRTEQHQTGEMHSTSNKSNILRRLRSLLVGLVVCSLVAFFLTSQWYFAPAGDSHPTNWHVVLGHYLVICYVWGLLTIGIFPTVDRIGIDRNHVMGSMAKFLGAGVVFSLAHFVIGHLFLRLLGLFSTGSIHGGSITGLQVIGILQSNLILFTVIACVCLAISYARKFRERELRASKLENQLTLAQLGALKSQLQPHFLFNTRNAIAALTVENPPVAEQMIVKLSDLLRSTLENVKHNEISLMKELEFSRRYLEIEKMRYGSRLIVSEQIDPDVCNAIVPTLVLQPLIENAIGHGVASVSSPCTVTIKGHRKDSLLHLEVSDTGRGNANGVPHRVGGVGLQNTRERLKHLYGDQVQFHAGNDPAGGFRVSIEIPFSEERRKQEDVD